MAIAELKFEVLVNGWSDTAKRFRPKAQGCRFGYPGERSADVSTATRLRPRMSLVTVET